MEVMSTSCSSGGTGGGGGGCGFATAAGGSAGAAGGLTGASCARSWKAMNGMRSDDDQWMRMMMKGMMMCGMMSVLAGTLRKQEQIDP
ncbi:MAG: hypothetical protein IKZ84_04440 [Victivallales bacterium]|nr:hypothetical protein [Victivallales bacterium]